MFVFYNKLPGSMTRLALNEVAMNYYSDGVIRVLYTADENGFRNGETDEPLPPDEFVGKTVRVMYEGTEYTGVAIGYSDTPSGGRALGVQLNVDVGQEIKYFLFRKNPQIVIL